MNLSKRLRPNSEAAPWVIEEVTKMESEIERLQSRVAELEQWQRDMVEKAASKSLDGYRELGSRAAAAENRADTLQSRVNFLERLLRYANEYVDDRELKRIIEAEVFSVIPSPEVKP